MADSKSIFGVCVNGGSFPFARVRAPGRAMRSAAWAGLTVGTEYASRGSRGEPRHNQLLCFPGNFVYWSRHKIEVSLGCLKGCLREHLVALGPFL